MDEKQARAEWVRITSDFIDQDPPITQEEWRRQLAVELILARLIQHLFEIGEHELEETERRFLNIPVEGRTRAAYANVFRRITFLLRTEIKGR